VGALDRIRGTGYRSGAVAASDAIRRLTVAAVVLAVVSVGATFLGVFASFN